MFRVRDPDRVALAVLHHLEDNEILAQKALDPVVDD
jgi:hypothetical protein